MTKGFASLLFILTLSTLAVSILSLNSPALNDSFVGRTLFLRRTEMENRVDVMIREELRKGLLLKLPADTIKRNINQQIMYYLSSVSENSHEPITYTPGFGALLHTQYSSLTLQEPTPLSLFTLNQNSHVLILPITGSARYGEYTYTGGDNATSILVTHIRTPNERTIFALPSAYRACATTIHPAWECAPYSP